MSLEKAGVSRVSGVDAVELSQQFAAPNMCSVSDLLDGLECTKRMMLKRFRPFEIASTSEQQLGEIVHMILSYMLINRSLGNDQLKVKCKDMFEYPGIISKLDIEAFVDRIWAQEWFQRVTQSGELQVEMPFEYEYDRHIVRGRFDAIWFSGSTFAILEFKTSLAHSLVRYTRQVHLYAQIMQSQFKSLTFDQAASGLIDLKTGKWTQIQDWGGDINNILSTLPVTIGEAKPNELACEGCGYQDRVVSCSTSVWS